MRIVQVSLVAAVVAVAWGCGADGLGSAGPVDGGEPDAQERADARQFPDCEPETCEDLGWACGKFETCGEIIDCADHGFSCDEGERCEGGIDGPTECVEDDGADCEVCHAIPDCSTEDPTRLAGRVVTPGRDDGDTGNQVGVPNAIVYILRTASVDDLPEIPAGLPAGGENCDRCEDQLELRGPVLNATVTDAAGRWELEGNIPVDEEIILVVTAGKFRRAEALTISADGACEDNALPEAVADNPTRLPRHMSDGLAVNIPRIAVTTGIIDAMECVFEKVGIDHDEFDNPDPGSDARIHLYRGVAEVDGELRQGGMRIGQQDPVDHVDADLYSDLGRLEGYDMVVADCKGLRWDEDFSDQAQFGEDVVDYVNRGGRMFSSHLSATWLHENGLADAADFGLTVEGSSEVLDATGLIARGRERASPRIEQFAAWMIAEAVVGDAGDFPIRHPRSQVESLGVASEEFVYCEPDDPDNDCTHETQQFSVNTPVGASEDDACGRVAYSGFHVTPAENGGPDPFKDTVFPEGCEGDLTDQEKVLLFALFDLAACIGDPVPPPTPCNPRTCEDECGFLPDGCGDVIDCTCPID